MEALANLLLLIFILVLSVGIGIGFDLQKPSSWVYVICGFLIGVMAGFITGSLWAGISIGILLAALAAWGGPIMYERKQQAQKSLKNQKK